MKHSNWIRQYHTEQDQIHMPNQCRQNILHIVDQEKNAENKHAMEWESMWEPQKHSSWKAVFLILALLIFAGFAAILAVSTQRPASNLPQINNIDIFASTEPSGESDVNETEHGDALTKKQIYYRCLNSALYLSQLSGTVKIYSHTNPDVVEQGSFSLDYENDEYYACVDTIDADNPTHIQLTTTYYHGHNGDVQNEMYILYDSDEDDTHLYNFIPFASQKTPSSPVSDDEINTMSVEEIEATAYAYEPTGIDALTPCFAPYRNTIEYLSDFDQWTIVDTLSYDAFQGEYESAASSNRKVVQIEGTTDHTESEAERFSLTVDLETGIWITFTTYRPDGEVLDDITAVNLNFYEDGNEILMQRLTEEDKNEIESNYICTEDEFMYHQNTAVTTAE